MFICHHMTADPTTVNQQTSLAEIREIFITGGFRHLPVVDDQQRLVGMVTDRDLRSASPSSLFKKNAQEDGELSQIPVATIMSRALFTLSPLATLDDALILLDREKVGALPVVDQHERVVGIFSTRDLMRAYRKLFGLGERGSAMIVVEHDGRPKPLSRIAKVLEEHAIRFTRLIRSEADQNNRERIYLRVNTINLSAVHHALADAGFAVVSPR